MSTLNDLGNEALTDGVDVSNLPEQGGSFQPFPQPGRYRFQLSPLTGENFSAVQSTEHGARVQVAFDANAPLVIVQSPKDEHNGEPFQTRISNVPRNRAKKGQPAQLASDWDYLNRALGEESRPASNKGYAETLIARSLQQPAPAFSADLEVSYRCGEARDAYFEVAGDDGAVSKERIPVEGAGAEGPFQQGCGAKYYQAKVTKVQEVEGGPTVYPQYLTCTCGAAVRGFVNLTRFGA